MPAISKLVLRIFAVPLFVMAIAPLGKAQGSGVGNTTSTPVAGVPHDYITGLNETVNPANGALSIRIGQAVPPERGQNWPSYAFIYDSNSAFALRPGWISTGNILVLSSLTYGPPFLTGANPVYYSSNAVSVCQPTSQFSCTTYTCNVQAGYLFADPDGGLHGLGLQVGIPVTFNTSNDCNFFGIHNYYYGGDERYKASMDSATLAVTVVDLHGDQTAVEDTNGNYHDTTHRTVSVPARSTIQTQAVSQPSQTYNVSGTSVDGTNSCTATSIKPPTQPSTVNVPKSVTLASGQQYAFQPDSVFGLLNKITYPTGATVTYTWSLIPKSQGARYNQMPTQSAGGECSLQYDWFAITKRVVSYNGVTNAEEQDFAYSTVWPNSQTSQWTSKATTVTTKDLIRGTSFKTVYNYLPMSPPAESDQPWEDLSYVPVENTIQYFATDGSLLKTTTKKWATISILSAACTTLPNGLTSGSFYAYQPYTPNLTALNPDTKKTDLRTDTAEYDYGQVSSSCTQPASSVLPVRETQTTYQSFANTPLFPFPALQDRPSTVITYGVVNGAKTPLAETDYTYDSSTPSPVSPIPYGHDETHYASGSTAPRGNATTVTKKCFVGSVNCTNSVTNYTYDTTGQVLSVQDANLNTTTYSYVDNYTADDGSPSANTNAFVTKITKPSTNGVAHVTKYQYGFNDGKLRAVTDENNLVSTYCYWTGGCTGSSFDPFVRLTGTTAPDGGKSTITYNDTALTETTSVSINATQTLTNVLLFDGMGRTKQNQLTSDPQGTVFTDTTYDGLGRTYTVSNPYRSGSDVTTSLGTTTYFYDALSRKCLEVPPDGTLPTGGACPSTQPANTLFTTYSNNTTTATDQTGKARQSVTDSLGRLTQVFEDPGTSPHLNYETDYSYDALGNMLTVNQKGGSTNSTQWRNRTFTYDSLSRLLTSTNPEVGTLTYTYDPNSNVLTKKDARSITTTYTYDALNREKTVGYSNADPGISINYDESTCLTGVPQCNNIGQRTSMSDAAGSETWSYDVPDRIHKEQRTTGGITKSTTYNFDYLGNITAVVYPTARTVNYTYDNANRPSTAVDGSNGITYASGFDTSAASTCSVDVTCYTPQGTFYALAIGETATFTGLNLTHIYNNRLQPLEFKASSTGGNAIDISYNFVDPASGKNAGHVYGIANNLDNTRSQNFTYDQLNRITSALTTSTHATSPAHCWGEAYGVDAWGNLQSIAATSNTNYNGCIQEGGFSKIPDGNNHLSGFSYDPSGNTSNDGTFAYLWDGESQLKSAGGVNYLYDGDGRRASKSNGKLYWYGSGGEILAETTAAGATTAEYVFFGGKRITMLPTGANPIYYVEDLLGSSRVTTTNTGVVCYDADYYPYGGERTVTNTCPQNSYKFEGKERDTETSIGPGNTNGNDDFGARYYSNRFGRWLSADWSNVPVAVPYANLTNPQTLNLYSMVADDPESFADLDGHCLPAISWGCHRHEIDDAAFLRKAVPTCIGCGGNPWLPKNEPSNAQNQKQKHDQDQKKDDKQESAAGGRGGGQGKGERGRTRKPENPGKHVRPSKEHPGQWEVRNPHEGRWVLKPKGWSPSTASSSAGSAISDFVHEHPVIVVGAAVIATIGILFFTGGSASPLVPAVAAAF